jgi:DNA-binding CsgD family transcriptional regulator
MMSNCWVTTIGAIDDIEGARSPQAVWAAMSAVAASFGFEHAVVLRSADGDAHFTTLHGTLQTDVAEAFAHAGFAGNASLARFILNARRPIAADEIPTDLLSEAQREALATARTKLNIGAGLIVPVQNEDVNLGALLLAGRDPMSVPIARSALHFLAQLAFTRVAVLEGKRENDLLSPREAECLRLSAHGNTDGDIGRKLGISARTARFHIENAKKKLGVATRVQAVAEALRRKAIAA